MKNEKHWIKLINSVFQRYQATVWSCISKIGTSCLATKNRLQSRTDVHGARVALAAPGGQREMWESHLMETSAHIAFQWKFTGTISAGSWWQSLCEAGYRWHWAVLPLLTEWKWSEQGRWVCWAGSVKQFPFFPGLSTPLQCGMTQMTTFCVINFTKEYWSYSWHIHKLLRHFVPDRFHPSLIGSQENSISRKEFSCV